MKKSYVEEYDSLSETHWWWISRNNFVLNKLSSLILSNLEILDVGCGSGTLSKELLRFGVLTAIEPDPDLYQKIKIVPADIQNCDLFAFKTFKNFDLIVMLDVLEHISDDIAAIQKLATLLKPNGLVFLNVPAYNSLWSRHDELNYHYRRYHREELEAKFSNQGFKILECRYTFASLFFLKKIFLLIEKYQGNPKQTIRIPKSLNKLLIHYFELENLIVNCKFGSSVFLVAKKI